MVPAVAKHSRDASSASDSEFGSFVSVADHPLGQDDSHSRLTPLPHSPDGLRALRDDTVQRAEHNERRILAEMQAHERDPLSWIHTTNALDVMKEETTLEDSGTPYHIA